MMGTQACARDLTRMCLGVRQPSRCGAFEHQGDDGDQGDHRHRLDYHRRVDRSMNLAALGDDSSPWSPCPNPLESSQANCLTRMISTMVKMIIITMHNA